MKKISSCLECGRKVYTNDIDLCKRCHNEVGATYLQEQEVFDEPEEEGPNLEGLDLGVEEGAEAPKEEVSEETPAEVKEEKK